jgi:hypothetical protein
MNLRNMNVLTWHWGLSQTRLIMCWLPTILKSLKPFITTFFIISWITINVFLSLKQNLILIHCTWISAISNITRHPVHAHEQIALGRWLITGGWHSKIIRKHTTRQHNLPDVAQTSTWRAISEVLKLFEQTMYMWDILGKTGSHSLSIHTPCLLPTTLLPQSYTLSTIFYVNFICSHH